MPGTADGIGLVVVIDELDRAAEHAALGVDVVAPDLEGEQDLLAVRRAMPPVRAMLKPILIGSAATAMPLHSSAQRLRLARRNGPFIGSSHRSAVSFVARGGSPCSPRFPDISTLYCAANKMGERHERSRRNAGQAQRVPQAAEAQEAHRDARRLQPALCAAGAAGGVRSPSSSRARSSRPSSTACRTTASSACAISSITRATWRRSPTSRSWSMPIPASAMPSTSITRCRRCVRSGVAAPADRGSGGAEEIRHHCRAALHPDRRGGRQDPGRGGGARRARSGIRRSARAATCWARKAAASTTRCAARSPM